MAGAEFVADVVVILGTLVGIFDQQADRRPGGDLRRHPFVLKNAGEDADLVWLLPLGDEFRAAGFAAIQIALDVGFREGNAGRTAVDHATQGWSMAFAKGRDAEKQSKGIKRHTRTPMALLFRSIFPESVAREGFNTVQSRLCTAAVGKENRIADLFSGRLRSIPAFGALR